jgi:PAS domain S-box-containing protein
MTMDSNCELTSENFYQLIDTSNCSIFWKDKEGAIRGCNKFMLNIFDVRERSQIIGKSEYDFLSSEDAERIRKIDQQVLNGVPYQGEECAGIYGETKIYLVSKNQLTDRHGNAIGIIGTAIDITAEKELQRLKLDAERQEIRVQEIQKQEYEKLVKVVRQVAHDINSPLASLRVIMPACDALPEVPRKILHQVADRIMDIANNLFSTYKTVENKMTSNTEPRQPLLISDLLVQLLSQKKIEYSYRPVKLELAIGANAHFAFAHMQPGQFSRSISNLINNAVDSTADDGTGAVKIKLTAYTQFILITIEDNGKGMPKSSVEKMLTRKNFTEGKNSGSEFGIEQVWGTLANNDGYMMVDSKPGVGTSICVGFRRIDAPSWVAQKIKLYSNSIIVVLDDDESIHGAWDMRFQSYLNSFPNLQPRHFEQEDEVLDFFDTLSLEDKDSVVFLCDYDLIGQKKNGLQIIEESGIKNATLVTSYYANPQVIDIATRLGIKILAKQMSAIVPIDVGGKLDSKLDTSDYADKDFQQPTTNADTQIWRKQPSADAPVQLDVVGYDKNENPCDNEFKDIDVIFVDDETFLLDGFRFFASGKKVDTYSDPKIFLDNITQYRKHTKIILDQNFANYDRRGTQIAEQLHAMGFQRLYLLTGESFSKSDIPHYLTFIHKGEMDTLKAALDE